MSTTKKPLKYTWTAVFEDGHLIAQPEDDRYSLHDDNAEWNPSSFKDILDYESKSPLEVFIISDDDDQDEIRLYLKDGTFTIGGPGFKLDELGESIKRKLIFFRNIEQQFIDGEAQEPQVASYSVGYEYKDNEGRNVQRILTVDG